MCRAWTYIDVLVLGIEMAATEGAAVAFIFFTRKLAFLEDVFDVASTARRGRDGCSNREKKEMIALHL